MLVKSMATACFLGNLFHFLEMEPKVVNPTSPTLAPVHLQVGIRFRNLTFRYQPGRPPAIQSFDLTVPAGKVVAIVGPNGAGKSTLVKLLCRFYDPDNGSIELDGVGIRDIPLEQLRRMISVLFQFPVPYHTTAGENISIADNAAHPGRSEIERAARSAARDEIIARLPKGYDTLLGKWFADGMELSAGEWQRVALRGLTSGSPRLSCWTNRPVSWTRGHEAEWFDRLRELASGRTAIVITHRFTIAIHADIIHVMKDGRIVESGGHSELVGPGWLVCPILVIADAYRTPSLQLGISTCFF